MHKLVILIGELDDWSRFDAQWPDFLRQAESMPGLLRESTARVERMLYGDKGFGQVHELYFNTLVEAQAALASPQGAAAGRLLQQISGGRITLFFADHREDSMENIRRFSQAGEPDA
jgi:hypothetical protein